MRRVRVIKSHEEVERDLHADGATADEIQQEMDRRKDIQKQLQSDYDVKPPVRPYQRTTD